MQVYFKCVGNSNVDNVVFNAMSLEPISAEEAVSEQTKLGYPEFPFDFFSFKTWSENGTYFASWRCYANCD